MYRMKVKAKYWLQIWKIIITCIITSKNSAIKIRIELSDKSGLNVLGISARYVDMKVTLSGNYVVLYTFYLISTIIYFFLDLN